MDIKNTFDNEASEYEFTSRAVNIYFDEALDKLVNNINVKKNNIKVLDICCGTGILTEKVAKAFPNAEFTGVDFSTGMLEIAKQRMKNYNFNYLISDVCDNKTMQKLGNYDLIISSFGIHNIHGYNNKKKALNNIVKHLNVGGMYITCDLIKGKDKEEEKQFYEFQKNWLLKTYNKEQTSDWLKLLAEEDDPETLKNNIKLLSEVGLKNIDLVWQKEFLTIIKCSK